MACQLRSGPFAACAILPAVYERPRQVKWFVGLQILAAALGAVLVVAVRNDIGWEVGLLHLVFVLFAYVAVRVFFVWKIWKGKNWARLTMFAWFLYTYIQYFAQFRSGATPIRIEPSLKALIVVVAVLQATSLALLFTRSGNEWFRPPRAKQSLLNPR
jgi:phosphatidylserine synthase